MNLDQIKFAAIVAQAKAAAANSPRWTRAIERAGAALMNGELIVTICGDKSLVTSVNGQYWVNGHCQCAAARNGHTQCYHRAAARLVEMYDEAIYAPKMETKPDPKPERRPTAPKITRSIERDYTGARYPVTYCDGWHI